MTNVAFAKIRIVAATRTLWEKSIFEGKRWHLMGALEGSSDAIVQTYDGVFVAMIH